MYNFNEISKLFIKRFYKNKKIFYRDFLKRIKKQIKFNNKDIKEFKANCPFYDINEIKIRVVRLKNINLYNKILKEMFLSKKFNYKACQRKIYMNKREFMNYQKSILLDYIHIATHLIFINLMKRNNIMKLKRIRQFLKK